MKKVVYILLITTIFILCGCEDQYVYHENSTYDEWISPDGVHYWMNGTGLAPRYDKNGNLVIGEKVEENENDEWEK